MKKHLMTKLLVIAMLLISVLGISAKTASAQIILPERSQVRSWGFDNAQEREVLPHTTFPMTEKQHYRKKVEFTVFADHFGGCQLYINKAFVPLSYYQMNEQQLASGRYELTITINDVYKYVDDGESQTLFEVHTQSSSGTFYKKTGLTIQWVEGTKPAAPENLFFEYNNPLAENGAILWGSTEAMEYRSNYSLETWQDLNENTIFNLPGKDTYIYIRYKEPQSKSIKLTLRAIPSTPIVEINHDGAFSYLYTSYEYKLNDGEYQDVTREFIDAGANSVIDSVPADKTYTYTFRVKGSPESPASREQVVTVYPRAAAPTGFTYEQATATLKGSSTAWQYRKKGSDKWLYCSENMNMASFLNPNEDVVIELRAKAIENKCFPSTIVEFTIPKLAEAPSLAIDYEKEQLIGFQDGAQYEWSQYASFNPKNDVTLTNGGFDISNLIFGNKVQYIYVRTKATSDKIYSATANIVIPKRPSAPYISHVPNDPNYPEKIVLKGLNEGMEYKKSTDSEWIKCVNDNDMVFDIPSANEIYNVRFTAKNSESVFASLPYNVTLQARPSAPKITYNRVTEIFTLNTSLEMRFDDQPNFYGVSSENVSLNVSGIIDSIPSGSTRKVYFRTAPSISYPASQVTEYILYSRQAAPTGVTYDPITMKVLGANNKMQYMLVGRNSNWTTYPNAPLDMQSMLSDTDDQILKIRFSPTATNSASLPVDLVIPKRPAALTSLSIDYEKEVIKGFESGFSYQYNTNGATTAWNNMVITPANEFDVSKILSNKANVNLYVRRAATSTQPPTAATLITLPKRNAAPTTPHVVANDPNHPEKIVLKGLTAGMEYKNSNDSQWIKCANDNDVIFDIPNTREIYYIQYCGNNDNQTFSSLGTSVSLYARANAPKISYNNVTETLTLLTTMEMRFDDQPNFYMVTNENKSLNLSGIIDSIPSGSTRKVYFRMAATPGYPASQIAEHTIYPRKTPPTGVTYDPVTMKVNGANNTMQYMLVGRHTSWMAFSNTPLDMQNWLSDTDDQVLKIRFAPTTTSAASLPVEITIPKRPAAPTGLSIDYEKEVIKGFTAGSAYQYNTNGSATSWNNMTITANNEFDLGKVLSSTANTNLYIRRAATSTQPPTAATLITLPKRNAAPTTPKFVANDPNHTEKIVLTGLQVGMEYKKSTDTQWIKCTNDNDIIFDIPQTMETYHIRYFGSNDKKAFASSHKSISLYGKPNAPNVTYNKTTEKTSALNFSMEYRFSGENTYTSVPSNNYLYNLAPIIDTIPAGETKSFYVRYKANSSSPASHEKEIILNARK